MKNANKDRIPLKSIQPDNEMLDALIYTEFSKGNPKLESMKVVLNGFIAQIFHTIGENEDYSKEFYIEVLDALFSFSNGIRQKYSKVVTEDFRNLTQYLSFYKHSKESIDEYFFNECDESEGSDDLSQTKECFQEQ